LAIIDFRNIYKVINPVFRQYLVDFRPYQLYFGGGGSGKSHFIAQKIIYNFYTLPGYNGIALRKVAAANHDSTFAELCKVLIEWGFDENIVKINHSIGSERIINLVNGNEILFKGMKDKREREKIKSVTFSNGDCVWLWPEEITEFVEDDFNQMDIRLRGQGTIPKHTMLSTNPIDEASWVKTRFIDNPYKPAMGFAMKTTHLDNKYLTKADHNKFESYKDIDSYWYQVYTLGNWGSINNAKVFFNIEVHDFDIPDYNFQNLRNGLDFGFVHAQALVRNGYMENELYIYKEYYKKGMDNIDFAQWVSDDGFPKDFWITADSEDPMKIGQWRALDFKVKGAVKGKDSVIHGVDYLRRLPKIHIHQTLAPNAAREFPRFKRRQLLDGTICEKEFVELDDDTIAATRYSQEEFIRGRGDGLPTVATVKGVR